MITTGKELVTFMTSLNAEANIDIDLLKVLVSNGKAILEEERPWSVIKKTDKTKTVTSSNNWQTAIVLSSIEDFSRFFVADDDSGIALFDGNSLIQYYSLKPFEQRLRWKDSSNTCVYDENTKTLYLNGLVPFSGTLWINYMATTDEIDLESDDAQWVEFPKRFFPILAYYAIGIFKGGVDYDSINRQMLPTNAAILASLKNAMEKWDNEKQLATIQTNDPDSFYNGFRSGAINIHD